MFISEQQKVLVLRNKNISIFLKKLGTYISDLLLLKCNLLTVECKT